MATIRNFNAKGGALNYRQKPVFPNNGGDPKPVRSRKNTTSAIERGRAVRAQRTASLGMGGVGSRGRSIDPA